MPRAFISYCSADVRFVEDYVLPWLDAVRIEAWFAPHAIRPSQDWERAILSGLDSSDWFIVVLSSKTPDSVWVRKEIDLALQKLPNRVVQLRLGECDSEGLDPRLAAVQHIQCDPADPVAGIRRLVQTLVDAEYAVIHRQLDGVWLSAVQPVYYEAESGWHVQEVSISPTVEGYIVETRPAEAKLMWRLDARVVANHFLVGRWRSKRPGSASLGYMVLQIARTGTYMCGHDYAIMLDERKAHYGALLLAKDESNLQKAWTAMCHAKRDLVPLSQAVDFPEGKASG